MSNAPPRARIAGAIAVAAAGLAGAMATINAVRAGLRIARLTGDAARAAWALVTLRLYRRCPECRRWSRGDAAVCWRCGWRRRGRRWPRPAARF